MVLPYSDGRLYNCLLLICFIIFFIIKILIKILTYRTVHMNWIPDYPNKVTALHCHSGLHLLLGD